MKSFDVTTRLVAEDGLYLPGSVGGAGGPGYGNGVIWRPGGVAGGNVFTTWATAYAAVAAVQGATTLYIDSSIAPAVVDPGTWNGFGCAKIATYSREASAGGYIFTISNGATFHDWYGFDGALALCQSSVGSPSFTFSLFGSFSLIGFATIALDAAATGPAIQIPAGGGPGEFAIVASLGGLDNSANPGIAVVGVAVGGFAAFYLSGFSQTHWSFLLTGNEIGGPVGSNVIYQHDDTSPPLTSALFFGTLEDDLDSQLQWGGSGGAAAKQVATSDGAGNVIWASGAASSYTPAVPGNWAGAPPTTIQQALDRIAANVLNAHPIP